MTLANGFALEDLASDVLVHHLSDHFNPPGLTNFLGCVQADMDITGFRALSFPPFGCGDSATASLFLDGTYFPAHGVPVGFQWFADRIERTAEAAGWSLRTTLVLVPGEMAAVLRIEVQNRAGAERPLALTLGIKGGITQTKENWRFQIPGEVEHDIAVDSGRGAIRFDARLTRAHMVQGLRSDSGAGVVATAESVSVTEKVGAGATAGFTFVVTIADDESAAVALHDRLVADGRAAVRAAGELWREEFAALFTPGNSRYGGWLPTLETRDAAVMKLWHLAALGLAYFRRDSPASIHGRAYDTLMPRYWQTVTFIWDYALSSLAHSLLDPGVQRGYIERWMDMDIHAHFGTEYLSGEPVGPWYSVNDYAMLVMARDQLRITGDHAWRDAVGDRLVDYAANWRSFRTASGLADYGGIGNLLECVGSYVHEVAAMNAANVWGMRVAAELQPGHAAEWNGEADALLAEVQRLYQPAEGWFHARHGDRLVPVRHCYDFFTVLNTVGAELPAQQRSEMVAFFRRELQAENWMRALSARDLDAQYSRRADHQWTGAYPAWPPQALSALFACGEGAVAVEWMHGLSRSANQGPFGQAQCVEDCFPFDQGGARKAPPDMPHICDWTVSSHGAWLNPVIEGLFGVRATLSDGITAQPAFPAGFDPDARLTNLRYQGGRYSASHHGIARDD